MANTHHMLVEVAQAIGGGQQYGNTQQKSGHEREQSRRCTASSRYSGSMPFAGADRGVPPLPAASRRPTAFGNTQGIAVYHEAVLQLSCAAKPRTGIVAADSRTGRVRVVQCPVSATVCRPSVGFQITGGETPPDFDRAASCGCKRRLVHIDAQDGDQASDSWSSRGWGRSARARRRRGFPRRKSGASPSR